MQPIRSGMADPAPPAQPRSILRGHKVQVHAATFIRGNQRLITGDAEGFVIVWDLTIMRPRAVWRGHQKAILGIREWGADRVITHGRDHEIIVWKLTEEDESKLSKSLPIQGVPDDHPKPWVQHVLPVNSMNFCAFAACESALSSSESAELLIAAPNALVLEAVDIFTLPDQIRVSTVNPAAAKGMSMALSLFELGDRLHLIAAYENGLATVARMDPDNGAWSVVYQHQAHSQPILSLDVSPSREYFITSGADAIIAKHPVPVPHAPVGNTVLDPGSGASRSAGALNPADGGPARNSGLSATFTKSALSDEDRKSPLVSVPNITAPLKVINTKHAGQQSLRIRSDGSIFATAGWDSKVRVYSTKSLKEVAVLKWHQVGCYATAFASIDAEADAEAQPSVARTDETSGVEAIESGRKDLTVKERRIRRAQSAHWLAAGSKDGKVSLWDIY